MLMRTFKGYVANKGQPKGCIAKRYIQEKTLTYYTRYKGRNHINLSQKLEKVLDGFGLLEPTKIKIKINNK